MENFKNLDIYGASFTVGDQGTIYRNGKLAHLVETPDGYYQVACAYRTIGVHRLVAMCFVDGRTEARNEVNHIDFDRKNNCASNLEWVTHAENVRHSAAAGRKSIMGERNPNYGNHTLSEWYAAHPEMAQINQSRPGARNGRATPIDAYKNGEFIGHFDYIGECYEYLKIHFDDMPSLAETFRIGVRRSKKTGTPYKGYTFVTQ